MSDLFSHFSESRPLGPEPLAERLRPKSFEGFFGQDSQKGPWLILRRYLKGEASLANMIFWGPPGSGKTSLANLIAQKEGASLRSIHAVDTGAKELKSIGEEARIQRTHFGRTTLLFIDEIHRLNKSQQDVLLPFCERGDFILLGATTENPSYELNPALLSRCQILIFNRIPASGLRQILHQACEHLGLNLQEILEEPAIRALIENSDGDARRLLTSFEAIVQAALPHPLSEESLRDFLENPVWGYQKTGDDHYDCISAFIKSVRGSDPDAAVYYLARMLKGGEDPVFIARRLVILASEDIGNADPRGLSLAVAALQAVELVGMPEARICLSQAATYLASAPKSNAAYEAINKAQALVEKTGQLSVPLSLRSARTTMAKDLGYGSGYKYSHEGIKGYLPQAFLPDEIKGESFYRPKELGFEKTIRQYLEWLRKPTND